MYASSWARLANFFFFFFQLYHFSAVVSRSLVGRVEDTVDSTQGLAAEGMQLVHRSSHGERKKRRETRERERKREGTRMRENATKSRRRLEKKKDTIK